MQAATAHSVCKGKLIGRDKIANPFIVRVYTRHEVELRNEPRKLNQSHSHDA
jgi:hypothetical protein